MEHEMFITADRVQGYDHEGLQDYNALFCLHSVLHIKIIYFLSFKRYFK